MKKRSDFESNRFFLACSLLIFYIGRNLVANPVCKVLKLLCLLHLFVQRFHCGKQQNVPDARAVCKEHYETVDTVADAARRGHTEL